MRDFLNTKIPKSDLIGRLGERNLDCFLLLLFFLWLVHDF